LLIRDRGFRQLFEFDEGKEVAIKLRHGVFLQGADNLPLPVLMPPVKC